MAAIMPHAMRGAIPCERYYMSQVILFDAVKLAVSIVAIDAAHTMQSENQAAVLAAFRSVTFDVYSATRTAVLAELVTSGKSINEAAAQKMFERVMQHLDITKPKSTEAKAVKQAESRTQAQAVTAAATAVAVKKYAGKGGDAHALAAGYTKAVKAGDATAAALLIKAAKAATDAQLKGQSEQLKERLAAVIAKIRATCKADVKALAKAERLFK